MFFNFFFLQFLKINNITINITIFTMILVIMKRNVFLIMRQSTYTIMVKMSKSIVQDVNRI